MGEVMINQRSCPVQGIAIPAIYLTSASSPPLSPSPCSSSSVLSPAVILDPALLAVLAPAPTPAPVVARPSAHVVAAFFPSLLLLQPWSSTAPT